MGYLSAGNVYGAALLGGVTVNGCLQWVAQVTRVKFSSC